MKKQFAVLFLLAVSAPLIAQPQPGPYFIATFFKVPAGKGQASEDGARHLETYPRVPEKAGRNYKLGRLFS